MAEISPNLRALIISARKDPARWGAPKGLSQAMLAEKVGLTETYLRRIETGRTRSAKADTLGNICFVLGIRPEIVRALGHPDVANAIEAHMILAEGLLPDTPEARKQIEEHLRETPGITVEEKDLLVEALGAILRREEPFGKELWRRREQKGK